MLVLILGTQEEARSQSSMVPMTHTVYSWLEHQRGMGRITAYHPELAPYTRSELTHFLRQIAQSDRPLPTWQQAILNSYLQEFDKDLLREASLRRSYQKEEGWRQKASGIFQEQPEPYLLRYSSEDQFLETYLYHWRSRAIVDAHDDGQWQWARYYIKGVNGFINAGDHVGFHIYLDNAYALGDYGLLRQDPEWGSSYTIREGTTRYQNSYSYEVFASLRFPYITFDIGRGSLSHGPAVTDAIVFRREAPNMGWFRYSIGNDKINFMYFHGALRSRREEIRIEVDGRPELSRISPDRWIAMHRLTLEPIPQITLGLFEMVQYSNRSMDINYLNPVMPFYFAELDGDDRDRKSIGGDLRVRPVRGTTVFGSLFIDDMREFRNLIQLKETQLALNTGLLQDLPFSSRVGLSYTRIDPFMYSHRFRLNAFEVENQPLGHALGPNAEEYAVSWQTWLPYRSSIRVTYRWAKKGMNPVDDEGNMVSNVGGDHLRGLSQIRALYDGADIHRFATTSLEVHTEPIRGLRLSLVMWQRNILSGNQIPSFRYLDFRFGFGF